MSSITLINLSLSSSLRLANVVTVVAAFGVDAEAEVVAIKTLVPLTLLSLLEPLELEGLDAFECELFVECVPGDDVSISSCNESDESMSMFTVSFDS